MTFEEPSPEEFLGLLRPGTKVQKVFAVLDDQEWHCRGCEYESVGTMQLAGSGGMQGLKRGTRSRPGLKIESQHRPCETCGETKYHDRWTGGFTPPVYAANMPKAFAERVFRVLGHRDVVEGAERAPSSLVIDHKLPMARWGEEATQEQTDYADITDEGIRARFQLLGKSSREEVAEGHSGNHNALKSRACERCVQTGRRGTPFGIAFFYQGGPEWGGADRYDAAGCIGCGWYDFAAWRDALNKSVGGGS